MYDIQVKTSPEHDTTSKNMHLVLDHNDFNDVCLRFIAFFEVSASALIRGRSTFHEPVGVEGATQRLEGPGSD